MKFSDSIKVFGLGVLAAGFLSISVAAETVAPKRVGPVSQYGQLQAGKNSQNYGRIYGSCKGVSAGNEVAVQGMSLFWSMAYRDEGPDYWHDSIVSGLVEKQNIQLIRGPVGVDGDWQNGNGNYFTNTEFHRGLMDAVVKSAIENDIYVIIDFHSHCAEQNTSGAQSFFSYMAEKWGGYDNVIFEIYNEPKNNCSDSWFDLSGAKNYWKEKIAPYARTVIETIRNYSDNLIVVGTPYFDQYTNAALAEPLNDANVAYSFHYYAGEDPYRHTTNKQGAWAEEAMQGGLSVFVTEWGNSAPSGDDGFNKDYSSAWYQWMTQNQLSGANWSVSNKTETASYFSDSAWNYSQSGNWVNENVFAPTRNKVYTACATNPASSSSSNSSSSVSSSSEASSSSVNSSSSVASSSSAMSSSSVASSSSANSSSSIASSSSVASSSSAKSSSSVASSSSVSSSSSVNSSSSVTTQVVVVGDLEQAVATGAKLETVTFKNVQQFNRNWGIYFLTENQNGSEVVISSTPVPDHFKAGDALTEILTINGQKYEIKLTVAGAASSSSALVDNSSSSSAEVSSSSEEHTTVVQMVSVNPLKVSMNGRLLQITGADYAEIEVFDMQGSPVASFKQAAGSVSLESLRQGNYIVRVRSGSNSLTRRIVMK